MRLAAKAPAFGGAQARCAASLGPGPRAAQRRARRKRPWLLAALAGGSPLLRRLRRRWGAQARCAASLAQGSLAAASSQRRATLAACSLSSKLGCASALGSLAAASCQRRARSAQARCAASVPLAACSLSWGAQARCAAIVPLRCHASDPLATAIFI